MQLSLSTRRRFGLAAAAASLLGLVYWPFHALAYFATEDGSEDKGVLPWDGGAADLLDPALAWSDADTVYVTFGKVTTVVVAGFLLGLLALHARQAGRSALERWGFRVALAGTSVLLVGTVVEYWAEAVEAGFVIAGPGLLIMLVGLTLFGAGSLRAGVAPRAGALLVALSLPLVALATVLLGHLSAGLIPLDVAWLLLGGWLWREAREASSLGAEEPATGYRGSPT